MSDNSKFITDEIRTLAWEAWSLNCKINDEYNKELKDTVYKLIDSWESPSCCHLAGNFEQICAEKLGHRYDEVDEYAQLLFTKVSEHADTVESYNTKNAQKFD